MSAGVAVNILWGVWYVTWIGAVLLFFPSGSGAPIDGSAFLGWITQKLWREPAWAGWALFALGFSMTARIEEGFLRAQLGAETYDAYGRQTPMLVPWTR